MKLDSSAAWKDAMASLSANREVMAAIAGVFFLLPSLALNLFLPEPAAVPANVTPEQAMKLLGDFYGSVAPFMLLMSVMQAIGMLVVVTLCTDFSRPTVGQAIRRGVAGFVTYFLSSLIMAAGFVIGGTLLLGIASATGIAALVALATIVLIVAIAYCAVRLSLATPVVAVERVRNPFHVLSRSWALTQGNVGRIGVLMFLIFVVFMVIVIAISAVAGAIAVLLLGAGAAKTIDAVLSAFLSAGFAVTFAALLAAIHRQLSGTTPGAVATTFD
jgi:hypothetical protein